MNQSNRWLVMSSLLAIFTLGAMNVAAQERQERRGPGREGRGNFDPEQMRERMMERMREAFEVKNDDEWKLIQGRIENVMEARREASSSMRFGGFGGRRGGPGGPGGRRGFGPEPSPEMEALQKSLESNGPSDEIKANLAKLRASRKAQQSALEKAQEDLRKVLTVRQEARAFMMGLVN